MPRQSHNWIRDEESIRKFVPKADIWRCTKCGKLHNFWGMKPKKDQVFVRHGPSGVYDVNMSCSDLEREFIVKSIMDT